MSGSGISWAICKSAPCSRQITMPAPTPQFFYRPDALPATQPTVSKHWRLNIGTGKQNRTVTQGLSDSKPWWLFPNPFLGFGCPQTRFSGSFLQRWRVEGMQTMYTACTSETKCIYRPILWCSPALCWRTLNIWSVSTHQLSFDQ